MSNVNPSLVQMLQSAVQHHQAGRLPQAEALYRQVLRDQPDCADALHMLGVLSLQVRRYDAGVDLIRRAIAVKPDIPETYSNLGYALNNHGLFDQAVAAHRQAIALSPAYPEAHFNLGVALANLGRFDEAAAAHRQAISLRPNYAEAHYNLGNALRNLGRMDEAIAPYRLAIALKPDFPDAHTNLGNALNAAGRPDEAIAAYRQALALKPNFPEAHANLGNALNSAGLLDEAIAAYRQALALNPGLAGAHSTLAYATLFHPACDARSIAEELRRWNHRHAEPLRQFLAPHPNSPLPDRRLRVGYVSPDFRDHVVGRNVLPIFMHHDRSQFEVFCYAGVARPDPMTEEFRRRADVFRAVSRMPHEALAAQIRADAIDVLVDLTLHMEGNRLLVFARKPAPVQVTFAGYPGSTGLDDIDYRLSDPYLDPPGADESLYSERIVRLPDSFWCYDPLEERDTTVNPLPARDNGVVTLGCLNNFHKVNPDLLALWAQVLRQVDGSRLLLLAPVGAARQRTLERLGQERIAPGRIEFVAQLSRRDYLRQYHRIDLGLDTFPYNGHTTSLDSFWMGVPVVTQVGRTVVGRAGWSQLSNLGLPELAGHTPEEFVRIAVDLARDWPRLTELRAALRRRMESSPLMDGVRFARHVEVAYRQMWRTWCAKPR